MPSLYWIGNSGNWNQRENWAFIPEGLDNESKIHDSSSLGPSAASGQSPSFEHAQPAISPGSKLGSVTFFLSRAGNPTGDMFARVYEEDGETNLPGNLLAQSQSVNATAVTSTSISASQAIKFNFSGEQKIILQKDKKYSYVIVHPDNFVNSSNNIRVNQGTDEGLPLLPSSRVNNGDWSEFGSNFRLSILVENDEDNALPTPGTDVIFDANSFSSSGQTVTVPLSYTANCNDITFENVTNAPELFIAGTNTKNVGELIIYGNATLNSSMTYSSGATGSLAFFSISSSDFNKTLNTNGATIDQLIRVNKNTGSGVLGSMTIVGGLDCTKEIVFGGGTITASNQTHRFNNLLLFTFGSPLNLNFQNSDIEIYGSYTRSSGTFNSNSGTTLTFTGSSDITFSHGTTLTIGELNNETSATVTLQTANSTLGDVTLARGSTTRFQSNITYTVTSFLTSGSSGLALVRSTSSGQHNLASPESRIVSDWLDLQNSNATGSTLWFAGSNSVDSGGN